MTAPQSIPPVGARVTITDGTTAGQHGEVVGHTAVNGHQLIRVRLDGATRSRFYAPSLIEETGIAQGDLFAGGA